jgi:predicted  nucleic acid-binding Zn-ribbon protein
MWRNTFCKYHFSNGCLKGEQCPFSHTPTIPRNPRPCNGCEDRSLCPFLHSDEKWTRWMPPITHPSAKTMDTTMEELDWVYERLQDAQEEAKILQQEMDRMEYDALDAKIQVARMKDDLESAEAAAEERGMINRDLSDQLEMMESTNQDLVNQLAASEAANQDLRTQLEERERLLVEQRDAVLKAIGLERSW